MKKTFKLFAAALAIVVAASCAKESANTNNEKTSLMTFSASINPETDSALDTKTSLSNKGLVEWNADDKITLYGNDRYNTNDGYNKHKGICTIDESTISNDKTLASFTGNVANSSDYCALYPAEGWSVDNSTDYKYKFVGLSEQTAVKESFDPSKHIMISSSLDGTRFTFKNICALAKVTIATDVVYSIKIEGMAKYGSSTYGSIGGDYGWKTNKTMFEYAPYSSNYIHVITLKDKNNTVLESGTYYIVLPACTISNYKVSVCDASGVVIGSKSKKSDFVVERSKVYDMGVFDNNNVRPVEVITVNPTSLNLSATTGFDFFSITSNVYWSIHSNVDWLTFSIKEGNPGTTSNIKVSASNNTSYTQRTATVTITNGVVSSTLTVTQAAAIKPQTYKKVKQVYPNELDNGKKYVIAVYGKQESYWTNQSNNTLRLNSLTNGEIRKENVLVFNVKGDPGLSGYTSQIMGTWKSLVNDYTLGESFIFGSGAALYTSLGGRWSNSKEYDIDMYKGAVFIYAKTETELSTGDATTAEAGPYGQGGRKWAIWEVTEEE